VRPFFRYFFWFELVRCISASPSADLERLLEGRRCTPGCAGTGLPFLSRTLSLAALSSSVFAPPKARCNTLNPSSDTLRDLEPSLGPRARSSLFPRPATPLPPRFESVPDIDATMSARLSADLLRRVPSLSLPEGFRVGLKDRVPEGTWSSSSLSSPSSSCNFMGLDNLAVPSVVILSLMAPLANWLDFFFLICGDLCSFDSECFRLWVEEATDQLSRTLSLADAKKASGTSCSPLAAVESASSSSREKYAEVTDGAVDCALRLTGRSSTLCSELPSVPLGDFSLVLDLDLRLVIFLDDAVEGLSVSVSVSFSPSVSSSSSLLL